MGAGVSLEQQTVSALQLVRGAHTSGRSHRFTAIKFRVANIDEWASLPGFSATAGNRELVQLTYGRPDLESARTECGAIIRPSDELRRSWPRATGGHITRKCWLLAENFGGLTFAEISSRYLTPLVSALTMCIGVASPVTAVQLKSDNRWCELWYRRIAELPSTSINAHDVLLPLPVVGIDVIANFVDISELTGPVAPVIADADSGLRRAALETQVLELTTVAEGVHRSLFDSVQRLSNPEVGRIRQLVAIALAFEPERHAQIVQGFLNYLEEPNYKTRLRGLSSLAEELLPGVTGRTNRWVTLTDRARNSFAHRTQRVLNEAAVTSTIS